MCVKVFVCKCVYVLCVWGFFLCFLFFPKGWLLQMIKIKKVVSKESPVILSKDCADFPITILQLWGRKNLDEISMMEISFVILLLLNLETFSFLTW